MYAIYRFSFAVLFLAFGMTSIGQARSDSVELVSVETERIHVSRPFHDQEDVILLVGGALPDTCYRHAHVDTSVDLDAGLVIIESKAYMQSERLCSQIVLPYVLEARLGQMPVGEYRVLTEKADGRMAEVGFVSVIERERQYEEGHLYLPVEEAEVIRYRNLDEPYVLRLAGTVTDSCMKFSKVYFQLFEDGTLVVHHTAYLEGKNCQAVEKPFDFQVPIRDYPDGRAVVHVHTLHGPAIQQDVEF